jgi:hypothetical protein
MPRLKRLALHHLDPFDCPEPPSNPHIMLCSGSVDGVDAPSFEAVMNNGLSFLRNRARQYRLIWSRLLR